MRQRADGADGADDVDAQSCVPCRFVKGGREPGVAARCSMAILPKYAIGSRPSIAPERSLERFCRRPSVPAGRAVTTFSIAGSSGSAGRAFCFPSTSICRRKKLTINFAGGNPSSDGGLLLLRARSASSGVTAACGSDAGSARSGARPVRDVRDGERARRRSRAE